MFEHNGYQGTITNVETEAGLFHGRVSGIQDVVTFEGKTVPELAKAFQDSVEDYLEFCAGRKEAPEKPFSGKFVVRLTPELHRLASAAASQEQISLNAWMVSAIETRLNQTAPNSVALSFAELEQVASCVAAMLAEKQRQPVASARKSTESAAPTHGRPGRRRIMI